MTSIIRYLTPSMKRRRTCSDNHQQPSTSKNGPKHLPPPVSHYAKYEENLTTPEECYSSHYCYVREGHMAKDSMRLVLLRKNKVLYDSATVIPLSEAECMTGKDKLSSDGHFQFLRHKSDLRDLNKMIFGAGSIHLSKNVKIHNLTGNRLLISRVFKMPLQDGGRHRNGMSESSCESTANSINSELGNAAKKLVKDGKTAPPEKLKPINRVSRSRQSSIRSNPEDAESCWPYKTACCADPWALSPPHRVYTVTRRTSSLNQSVIQDNGQIHYVLDHLAHMGTDGPAVVQSGPASVVGMGEEVEASDIASDRESEAASPPSASFVPHHLFRKPRGLHAQETPSTSGGGGGGVCASSSWSSSSNNISTSTDDLTAIGVIFAAEHRHFIMQHMPVLEKELHRLEARICVAAQYKHTFFYNIYQAWCSFVRLMCILHNSPRLREPAWMRVQRQAADSLFVTQWLLNLQHVVEKYDTKETNFFVSNVLSAVLMTHMSWTASVASPPVQTVTGTWHIQDSLLYSSCNAHSSQWREVMGVVGGSDRRAHTVVVGDDGEALSQLLHFLSYFIRCTLIDQRSSRQESISPTEEACEALSPFSLNSTGDAEMRGASAMSDSSHSSLEFSVELGSPVEGGAASSSSLRVVSPSTSIRSLPHQSGLGESLLAGPSIHYSPHFVLSALLTYPNSNHMARIVEEMQSLADAYVQCPLPPPSPTPPTLSPPSSSPFGSPPLPSRLDMPSQPSPSPVLHPPPDVAVVVADMNNWTVRVVCGDDISEVQTPSDKVVGMLETVQSMVKSGITGRGALETIEDYLGIILLSSTSLVELLMSLPPNASLSPERVKELIDCEISDLRMLINVASVYCPSVRDTERDA